MTTVILPVGKPMGAFYVEDQTEGALPKRYAVHIADDVEELSFEEWMVWLAAHDLPDKQEKHEFTRYVLRDHIRKTKDTPVANPVPHIEKLLERGLLAEADLLGADQESFLRRYRIMPCGFGMGNSIGDVHMVWIGLLGQRMVALPNRTFEIYSYSYRVGSMWDACVEFAEDTPNEAITPAHFADGIADALPMVVGALPLAYLEPVT